MHVLAATLCALSLERHAPQLQKNCARCKLVRTTTYPETQLQDNLLRLSASLVRALHFDFGTPCKGILLVNRLHKGAAIVRWHAAEYRFSVMGRSHGAVRTSVGRPLRRPRRGSAAAACWQPRRAVLCPSRSCAAAATAAGPGAHSRTALRAPAPIRQRPLRTWPPLPGPPHSQLTPKLSRSRGSICDLHNDMCHLILRLDSFLTT